MGEIMKKLVTLLTGLFFTLSIFTLVHAKNDEDVITFLPNKIEYLNFD